MNGQLKRSIFDDLLSEYIRGDNEIQSEITLLLDKHIIHSYKRFGEIKPDHFVIPTFLQILSVSDYNTPMINNEENELQILFSVFTPKIDVSQFIEEENLKGERIINSTREAPLVMAGWFNNYPNQKKKSRLALVYSAKCLQHRRDDIISLGNPITFLYRNHGLSIDYINKIIANHKKEIRENFKKSSKKWREWRQEKLNSRRKYIKTCANCGREFIAYRSDTRACSLSACKKSLSRKEKVREYHRK